MDHDLDILILTASFGSGHLSVATAIKEYIQKINKKINIEIIDAYQILIPKLSKVMYDGYAVLVKKSPRLYNYFYYKDNEKPNFNINMFPNKYLIDKLKNYILDINPKLIISTFPVISQYLSIIRDTSEMAIPFITCITDIVNGWEWISPNCDMYFVATKHNKREMLKMGIHDEKIFVTGIPLKKDFLESQRPRMNDFLSKEHIHILIAGGSMGLIPEDKDFYYWMNKLDKVTTIVLTGKNDNLYKSLSKLKLENVMPLKYTNQVASLMMKSDLLISKSGGITLFEAIASELPLIVYRPELGQEIENAKFVCQESIGSIALDIEELKYIITDLINKKKKINDYKTKIVELKKDINMKVLAVESVRLLNN